MGSFAGIWVLNAWRCMVDIIASQPAYIDCLREMTSCTDGDDRS